MYFTFASFFKWTRYLKLEREINRFIWFTRFFFKFFTDFLPSVNHKWHINAPSRNSWTCFRFFFIVPPFFFLRIWAFLFCYDTNAHLLGLSTFMSFIFYAHRHEVNYEIRGHFHIELVITAEMTEFFGSKEIEA